MRIDRIETSTSVVPLKEPFTIAFHTTYEAEMVLVRIIAGTHEGIGTAVPFGDVTGESFEATQEALSEESLEWLVGRDFESPAPLCRELKQRMGQTPAARAALDMALHDLWGKSLGKPLVDLFGREHDGLLTSMTLGMRTMEESLEEARLFLGMGYRILKVKGGKDLEYDLELLTRIREEHGPKIGLRTDPNQGYDVETLTSFFERSQALNIEFVEQPMPVDAIDEQRTLPESLRERLAVDENLMDEAAAFRLFQEPKPAHIGNIKLMKCGGVHAARRIATVADLGGVDLMWGCMIESVIGLAAALHTALSCPNTRYLDLDGDYDLVEDIATGGMVFENGRLRTPDAPGLGVTLK